MKGFGRGKKYNEKKENEKDLKILKEKIINQAFSYHSQGNIIEASKYYKDFIDQGFLDHRVYSNLGVILKEQGKLNEAEILIRKAIKHSPGYANAYSNLGNLLQDQGKIQEAVDSYRKAIDIDPKFAHAISNLGNILTDLAQLEEAELLTRKAILLKPNFAEPYNNLGNIMRKRGNLIEAKESTEKAIKLKPNYAQALSNLGNIYRALNQAEKAEIYTREALKIDKNSADFHCCLGLILNDLKEPIKAFDSLYEALRLSPKNINILNIITRFLRDSAEKILDKEQLSCLIDILLERDEITHQELFSSINYLYKEDLIKSIESLNNKNYSDESIRKLIQDKKLIKALKKMTFKDMNWEIFLTKVREKICSEIGQKNCSNEIVNIDFICGLAEQCFQNEYVYCLNKEEDLYLNKIKNRFQDSCPSEEDISILACYSPLYRLIKIIPSIKSYESKNINIKSLFRLQIEEPLEEIKLTNKLKKLGSINDATSIKVQSQYEHNPYPRWKNASLPINLALSSAEAINCEIKPNIISCNSTSSNLKVLIAGCGTGNQIMQALRYKNAEITGIDLSISSLAYAQRKINELGIKNVNLIQMDILEVSLLKDKFDIIECCGVLHHMNNPIKGLQALLNVFKHNGFMKLALYSELARENIIQARKYIKKANLLPTEENIRSFRNDIFSGAFPKMYSLTNTNSDFYSTSECRDLCFHYQEHRFTIKQLKNILTSNNLKFLGFFLSPEFKALYKSYFPQDQKQINLENWEEFEIKHPRAFASTPGFWVTNKNHLS